MTPTDVELMLLVKDGDTAAFAELVGRHFERLTGFFWKNLGDRTLAEDFSQEVFLRLFRAAERYTPTAKFTTFLYRIAKNYLTDHYRSAAIRPTALSLDGQQPGGSGQGEGGESRLVDHLEGNSTSPAHGMEQSELEQAIMRAIGMLAPEQRLVFTMSEIDGMKYPDISEALEIPVGTVKSRMHAAFHKLRELLRELAPYGAGGPDSDSQPPDPPMRQAQ